MHLPLGKRKTGTHEGEAEHIGKPATAKGRTLLLLSQVLAALSIACLTVGAALLQRRLHKRRSSLLDQSVATNAYKDVFQSAHYTPYPNAHSHQWQLIWWIIGGSALLWLATVLLILRAVRIVQWSPALVGFHVYFLVLCTFVIDSFLWINHYHQARNILGKKRLAVALAGLFGLAVADALAVLALGMISSTRHIDSRRIQGTAGTGGGYMHRNRVHHDAPAVETPMAPRTAEPMVGPTLATEPRY